MSAARSNKRRRGGRRNEHLLVTALEGSWKLNLALCAGSLMLYGFIHRLMKANPFAPVVFVATDSFLGLAALGFGVLAVFKFARSHLQTASARSDALNAIPPLDPGFVERWQASQPAPRSRATEIRSPADRAPALPAEASAQRPQAWSLEVLRDMEWKRFEEVCLAFYRAKGIRAESTPLGPDGGVDVRLYQAPDDPSRCTAIVQCKAWGERYVGVKPVRELRGVMAHEKTDKAFFMAPGAYSDDARAFASENRITLIDGPMFLAMLRRLSPEVGRQLLAQATAGDWTTPSCPSCGTKMLAREGRAGKFWGCTNYPRCRQKLGMRGERA